MYEQAFNNLRKIFRPVKVKRIQTCPECGKTRTNLYPYDNRWACRECRMKKLCHGCAFLKINEYGRVSCKPEMNGDCSPVTKDLFCDVIDMEMMHGVQMSEVRELDDVQVRD